MTPEIKKNLQHLGSWMRWTLNWVFSVEQVYNNDDSLKINPRPLALFPCHVALPGPSQGRLTAKANWHETSHRWRMSGRRTETSSLLEKKIKGTLFPEKKLPASHTQLPKVKWVLMNIGLNCATKKKTKEKQPSQSAEGLRCVGLANISPKETHQKTRHKPNRRFGVTGTILNLFYGGLEFLAVKVKQPEFENFDRKCNSFNGFYSHKSDLPKIYWAFDLWYLKARHNSGRSAPEKKYHKNNSCQSSSQDNASDLATARKKNKTAKV